MMLPAPLHRLVARARTLDARMSRRPGRRRLLINSRTPVNYTMVAPVHGMLARDSRVQTWFTATEEPERLHDIYREANGRVRLISPVRAALQRFDVYLTSDFIWAALPRGTRRVQMFHGVAGKYNFDAPDGSMRQWDGLFFVNRRRLRNFIACGAIDADSPAIRLIGMPKVDCLVDGSLRRDEVLAGLGLDPRRPTVLYAPTWSPASSLNAFGVELVTALVDRPLNVIVKLHDRSCDLRYRFSGGVDWRERMSVLLPRSHGHLAAASDVCPYLAAADVLITDHSSAGFEYLLLDRPVVRFELPRLLETALVHPDYAGLLAEASVSVCRVSDALGAVEGALSDPRQGSASRRAVAEELFHEPGTATARCVGALYDLMELELGDPDRCDAADAGRCEPAQAVGASRRTPAGARGAEEIS